MKTGLLTAGLLMIFAAAPAFCQASQRVKIDFSFGAGNAVYPAGEYQLLFQSRSQGSTIVLQNASTQVALNVVTRLPRTAAAPQKVALVFDRVGKDQFLSEVWVPGQDGYVVGVTKERHDHNVVEK